MLALALVVVMSGCSQLQGTLENAISDLGESVLNQANADSVQTETEGSETSSEEESQTTVLSSSTERFTEEELAEPVETLVNGAFEVCAVFYNGTQASEDPVADADGNPTAWYPVEDERFSSIDDMKAFAEQYYTNRFAVAALYAFAFEGDYPTYSVQNGVLCINKDVSGGIWDIEWAFDTLKIVSQTENSVIVEMETQVAGEDGGVKQISLTHVNGEWRLDSSILGA